MKHLCNLCALKGTPACDSAHKKSANKIISYAVAVPTVPWKCDHKKNGCLEHSCPMMACASSETPQAQENRRVRGCPLDDGKNTIHTDSCRFAVEIVEGATFAPTNPFFKNLDDVIECDKFAFRSVDDILDNPDYEWEEPLRGLLLRTTEVDLQKRGRIRDSELYPLDDLGIKVCVPRGGKKVRFCYNKTTVAKDGKGLIDYLHQWEQKRLANDAISARKGGAR